jgi:rRNA-processing protein FCF1
VGELVVGQSEEASIDSGGHYTEGSRHGRGKVSLEAGMRKREGGRREGTRSQEEAASSVERRAGQNAELTVMTTDEERLERAIREGE